MQWKFIHSSIVSVKVSLNVAIIRRFFNKMADSNPIIEIEQGKLKGTLTKSLLTGNEYCSFLGIPFAKPPIGNLRFQVCFEFYANWNLMKLFKN